MSKSLVVYFSASGVTKKVAETLAAAANADIYEIQPKTPYTEADLNWMDKTSRSSVEMKDLKSRPEIVEDTLNIEDYDVIFLGFPIWWYVAPTIINTFLEKHKFYKKKIVLFATSGGSGLGRSAENIRQSVSVSSTVIEGKIFNNNPSVEELQKWIKSLYI